MVKRTVLLTVRPMPHLKDILEAKGRWHMRQTPPLQYLQGSQNKLSHCIYVFCTAAATEPKRGCCSTKHMKRLRNSSCNQELHASNSYSVVLSQLLLCSARLQLHTRFTV